MNRYISSLYNHGIYLTLLATLALPSMSNAEVYEYKVVFAEVAGIEEISDGNLDAAIEILESRLKDTNSHHVADELATLCALYIMKRKLAAAHRTCDVAVENDQSYAAYNNRGVLRATLKNAAGAMEDFARIRVLPAYRQHYLEEFTRLEARLLASSNYDVAERYAARHADVGQSLGSAVHGASVEDLGN